jgi:hypothetical protein
LIVFSEAKDTTDYLHALGYVRTSSFGPHLRLLRGFLRFPYRLCFPRFHLEFLLWNSAHHSSVVTRQ